MAINCKEQGDNRETYTSRKGQFKIPVTNVSYIIKFIMALINMPSFPSPNVSKYIVAAGIRSRPGCNAADLTGRVINRKPEAGIPTTPLPSGNDNLDLKMERIRSEETVRELITKAKVKVIIDIGQISVATTGGPYAQSGYNTNVVEGNGGIQ